VATDFQFPIGAQQILTPDTGDEPLTYEEQQEAWILRDRAVEDFLKDVAQTADVAVLDGDGLIPADQLGQGATGTSVFLRGDRQWAVVPGAVAGTHSVGISSQGNTGGSTGLVTGTAIRLQLVGSNNITLSQSSNGASATVTIFGAAGGGGSQSAGISNLGNTSGTTGIASGSAIALFIAAGNNITASQSVNGASATITLSGPNTAAQSAESQTHGMSNLGNTSGTSGVASGAQVRMLLAGGNNVTLSQSLNGASGTITISAASQSAQALGLYASSQTTLTSSGTADARSLSFRGVGGVTVGVSASEVIISGGAGGAAGSNTFGMSNLGNTAGTSGTINGSAVQLLIVGSQNVTASQSINGSSATISLSANPGFSAGVSNLGLTAGSTGVTGTRLVLVGTDGLALSQSTDANGATITFDPPTVSRMALHTANMLSGVSSSSNMQATVVSLQDFEVQVPVALTRVEVPVIIALGTSATANTAANVQSWVWGLYSSSGDTLTPISAGSSTATYTWASNTGRFSSLTGARLISFAMNTTLTPGHYVWGMQASSASTSSIGTATTRLSMTIAPVYGNMVQSSWAPIDAATSNSSNPLFPWRGQNTVSLSNVTQTMQRSQIVQGGNGWLRANNVLILRSA